MRGDKNSRGETPAPAKAQRMLVAPTALCVGAVVVLLDVYGVFGLQNNRDLLDPLRRQVGWDGLIVLLGAGLVIGGALGGLLGLVQRWTQPLSQKLRWLPWLSSPLLLLIIVALLAAHWLSYVVFDAVHAFILLDGLTTIAQNAQLVFTRMLQTSHGDRGVSWLLLVYYYPSAHTAALVVLVGFLLLRRRIADALTAKARRWTSIAALGLFSSALVASVGLFAAATPHRRQVFCGSLSLSASLSPLCTRVLRPASESPVAATPPPRSTTRAPSPASSRGPASRAARPHHVVLVLLESVSPRHLQAYGYARATSPNLARMTICDRFEFAFAGSNVTHRSFATIFTGQAFLRGAITLGPRPIFPELLRRAGYRTAFFGTALGFEGSDRLLKPRTWTRFFDTIDGKSYTLAERPPCTDDCHMLREFEKFLREGPAGQPTFVTFAPYTTHFAYSPPPSWKMRFIKQRLRFYSPLFYPRSEQGTVVDYYDNAIAFVDDLIARLLAIVDKRLGLDNTLVLITSDHAEDLYAHGEPSHGTNLYNSQVRVPLFACTGGRRGRLRRENAAHIDIAPTVLRWAGLAVPRSFEGSNLLAPLPKNRRLLITSDFLIHADSLIVGRHKYILDHTRRLESLFDFKSDPQERSNLSSTQGPLLRMMRRVLAEELRRRQLR